MEEDFHCAVEYLQIAVYTNIGLRVDPWQLGVAIGDAVRILGVVKVTVWSTKVICITTASAGARTMAEDKLMRIKSMA